MNNDMPLEVKTLFDLIYPNDLVTLNRLCYKTNTRNHLVTMIAKGSGEFIGHAKGVNQPI